MSKVYYAFDPSMIGKVITHNGKSAQLVGKLRDYTIIKNGGETYYSIDGDSTDVVRTLIEGDTIEVHSWAEPDDSLAEIATALTGMYRNQG